MDVNEITLPINQIVRLSPARPLVHSKQHFIERTVIMLINFTIRTVMNKHQTGFTLIELVVTLAVLAIVVALGVSGLQYFTESNRAAAQNNLIIGTLTSARSEAIKRGARVVVCTSGNPTAATPSCLATSPWQNGWIVFVDNNQDGNYTSPGDTLLGVSDKLTGGLTIHADDKGNNPVSAITFMPNGGMATSPSEVTFTICTPDAATNLKMARAINIISSGLTSPATDTDASPDHIVNELSGNNVTCP
jgi:type IV fimbrial biogenesis protein FimT